MRKTNIAQEKAPTRIVFGLGGSEAGGDVSGSETADEGEYKYVFKLEDLVIEYKGPVTITARCPMTTTAKERTLLVLAMGLIRRNRALFHLLIFIYAVQNMN